MPTILPKQQYFVTKPDPLTGEPVGGGYTCGACGLEGLTCGEPHIAFAGHICEPHPDGKEITTYARNSGELATRKEVVEERPVGYDTYEPAATEVAEIEEGRHNEVIEPAPYSEAYGTTEPYPGNTASELPLVVDKPFVL